MMASPSSSATDSTVIGSSPLVSTGTLFVTPPKGMVGTFEGNVTIRDNGGASDSMSFVLRVTNVNDPPMDPMIIKPSNGTTVMEGTNVTFEMSTVRDPDMALGQVLNITWSSDISGVLMTMTSDDIHDFIRNDLPVGNHSIVLTVSDGEFEEMDQVLLVIKAEPEPPTLPPNNGQGPGDDVSLFTAPVVITLIIIALLGSLALAFLYIRSRRQGGAGKEVDGPPAIGTDGDPPIKNIDDPGNNDGL